MKPDPQNSAETSEISAPLPVQVHSSKHSVETTECLQFSSVDALQLSLKQEREESQFHQQCTKSEPCSNAADRKITPFSNSVISEVSELRVGKSVCWSDFPRVDTECGNLINDTQVVPKNPSVGADITVLTVCVSEASNTSATSSEFFNTSRIAGAIKVANITKLQDRHSGSLTRCTPSRNSWTCGTCGLSCACKSQLERHNWIHTGEKPFKCETCGKAFAQNSTLTRHVRTHTGEKPFECSMCHASFAQKTNLTSHIRTHTGEKPFKCSICANSFSDRSTLRNHIQTHRQENIRMYYV